MPTLREAQALFDAKSEAGEVPNRVTGEMGKLAQSRRGPIMTHVTAALRHAMRGHPEYSALNADALLDTEIAPFLATLPDHAELDARESERSDPSKERSNVALFVTVVTGRDAVREKKPIERARVLPAWQPLYDALWCQAEREPKKRTYPRLLIRFMELALANGIMSPQAIPDDYEAVHAWAPALGFSKKNVHEALGAFRSAADALGDDTLPRAYDFVFRDGIGIRALPDWVARARAAGMTGDPMAWPLLDVITALAPHLGDALRTILDAGKGHNRAASYEEEMIQCVSWIVASLIRLGEDPGPMTLLDLFLERREVRVERTASAEEGRSVKLAQLAKYTTVVPRRHANIVHHCLLRRCLDNSAPLSYARSPLWLINLAHEEDVIPIYTESLIANVKQTFLLTKAMFGAELEDTDPDLWGRVRNEYDGMLEQMSGYNRGRHLDGRKPKKSLLITWPQAVCMGLPYLRAKAIEARRLVVHRSQRIGHLESRESQKLLLAYYEALRDYIVAAILLDDSLRITNYAGALAGVHLKPVPEIAGEQWGGFQAVSTHFRGADADGVKLKVLARKEEGLNERERPLTPGLVDMDLLFEWWTMARPFYLAQAGLLASVDAYDPRQDQFAVFPTGRPSEEQRADASWRGNMSADMLSEIFGRALHEICVEVLKRDLPGWDDPKLTADYRSLFSAHIVRLLVATYFGGILGDWATAEYRTNDREETLRKHYNHLAQWFLKQMHTQSPENPRWFDAVIMRVLEARTNDAWGVFWDRFDPLQPQAGLGRLDHLAMPKPPKRRRRRMVA